MEFKIKNPAVKSLVKSANFYGNLLLNDVAQNGDGEVITKMEKERSDKKARRSYYNATFTSFENLNVSRTVTMWQSHTSNGEGVIWKQLNPKIAGKFLGGTIPGHVADIRLTEEYQIGDNFTNKVSLYIPHPDEFEPELERFLIQNELIVKDDEPSIDEGEGAAEQNQGAEGEGEGAEELIEGKQPEVGTL